MAGKANLEAVLPQLSALAGEMGYALKDAELAREGKSLYLRIYIDKPGGITLNDCEAYHRKAAGYVEDVDYDFLEVCSPGLDRPLKTDRDFEENAGETVEVHLYRPRKPGGKVFTGTLLGRDADGSIRIRSGSEETVFSRAEVSLCRRFIEVDGSLEAGQDWEDGSEEQ